MSVEIITYFGFIVAACILIWAVYELAKRYDRKRYNARDLHRRAPNTWVQLDTTSPHDIEAPLSADEGGGEEEHAEQSLHSRARQNGHYSESKKPS